MANKEAEIEKDDILEAINELSKVRAAFVSEADFQFALAWQLKKSLELDNILLEYPVECKGNRIYIDIVLVKGNQRYPIELKYITKQGEVNICGSTFNLKYHGAPDLARYGYIKDICRIENLQRKGEFSKGFAIILTNDSALYTELKKEPTANDAAFRIHQDRKVDSSVLRWAKNCKLESMEPLIVRGKYQFDWAKYIEGEESLFRYLITEVACN